MSVASTQDRGPETESPRLFFLGAPKNKFIFAGGLIINRSRNVHIHPGRLFMLECP
jgi:hypothetical protein